MGPLRDNYIYNILIYIMATENEQVEPEPESEENVASVSILGVRYNIVQTDRLYLEEKNLQEIPPNVFKLTNLRGLSLDDNLLSSLPPEIEKLEKLMMLSLDFNYFDDF